MNTSFSWLGTIAVAVTVASAARHHAAPPAPRTTAPSACAADSNFQRLAFWVGDWEVLDSAGAHYATQRVRNVVDECAITVEWTGRVGDKGMSLSAFDRKTGDWKQVYVSNQVPAPSGIKLRRSDPSYVGPGVRFIPLAELSAGTMAQTRVTIAPLSGHRAMQEFEDSADGGKTWHTVFKAEHRLQRTAGP